MRHQHRQSSPRSIVDWRVARLREAGFPQALAEQLAGDGRWDLHELLELVDRGCKPELAARILAPMDDERPL